MLKEVTLRFEMEDNGDIDSVVCALKTSAYVTAVEEITQLIRKKLKYSELTDDQSKLLEDLQDEVFDIISELPRDL